MQKCFTASRNGSCASSELPLNSFVVWFVHLVKRGLLQMQQSQHAEANVFYFLCCYVRGHQYNNESTSQGNMHPCYYLHCTSHYLWRKDILEQKTPQSSWCWLTGDPAVSASAETDVASDDAWETSFPRIFSVHFSPMLEGERPGQKRKDVSKGIAMYP